MTKTMTDVEIFGAGTWTPASGGTITITTDDLDTMVANFAFTKESLGFKPRLKLGHQDTNKFFGGTKGAPNFGFVDEMKRVGDKLVATFRDVPTALFDLMRTGRYNTVSVEVLPKVDIEGRTFQSVLTAVAVLGAELPAVKGLAELADVMLAEDDNSGRLTMEGRIMLAQQTEEDEPMTTKDTAVALYSQDQHQALVDAAVAKAVADTTAKFDGELKTLKGDLEATQGKLKEAKTALVTLADAAQNEKLGGIIDGAIKEGKALPAQRDMLFAMGRSMAGSADEFAAGEDGKKVKGLDAFAAYMNAQPTQIEVDTETGAASSEKPGKFGSAEDEILDLVAKAQKEDDKLDYGAALSQVLANCDQKLKDRYAAGE